MVILVIAFCTPARTCSDLSAADVCSATLPLLFCPRQQYVVLRVCNLHKLSPTSPVPDSVLVAPVTPLRRAPDGEEGCGRIHLTRIAVPNLYRSELNQYPICPVCTDLNLNQYRSPPNAARSHTLCTKSVKSGPNQY